MSAIAFIRKPVGFLLFNTADMANEGVEMFGINLQIEENAQLAALSALQAAAGKFIDDGMIVVDECGRPVEYGQTLALPKGRIVKMIGAIAPRGESGSGRVMVQDGDICEILSIKLVNLFWFDQEEFEFA